MNSLMGKPNPDTGVPPAAGRFVFCSSNDEHAGWLAQALDEWQIQQQELLPLPQLLARIEESGPRLVFLDFSGNCGSKIADCTADMVALAQELKKKMPHCLLIAVGTMSHPEGTIAALRAGVHCFIDMSAAPQEAREVMRKLMTVSSSSAATTVAVTDAQHGSLIALLGARAGIGTTTLAVHLADFLRRQKIAGRDECRVALLDLGWPAGDGQLYLNVSGHFHFTDVVNNRQRLDQTLIQTALAHSQSGIGVISLPRALRWMDDLNDADMVVALTLLRSYFDVLVMDLGGLPDPALAIRMAAAADKTWLLSDQSTGSLVSLAALIAESDRQGAQRMAERRLIVNRYDKQYGMSAEQIAGRFQLELIAAIPDRTAALMDSANQGKLLHQVAGNDPYLEALAKLAEEIPGVTVKRSGIGALSSWLSGTLFEKQRAAWQK